MADIDEESLTVFCPAWGPAHLDMLSRYALPSVMQDGNLPACGYNKIIVEGSSVGNSQALRDVLTQGFSKLPVEVRVMEFPAHEQALLSGLRQVIRLCMHRHTRLLLLMPDTIIANGGIFNMLTYCRDKPVSVAAPHLRVNADTFTATFDTRIFQHRMESSELVNLAMIHAHQSLSASYARRDNGTQRGGISLTYLSDRLTTIIHYLPTVYLAWFEESDAAFFDRAGFFGFWDHQWNQHLAAQGRLRVFGSSELFFAVELTRPDYNRISVVPGSRLEEHSEEGLLALKSFVGVLHG
jgi:hypothetical protein